MAGSPTEVTKLSSEVESARHTVATDDYPMSIGEIISLYREHELVINPQFQRLFRWSVNQKSNLIESLLIGIPVPPIFVFEKPDGVWELIDGLQRISTILEFFGELRNEHDEPLLPSTLVAATYLPSLEGAAIDPHAAAKAGASRFIPKALQTQLKRAKLGIQILKASSSEKSKFDVFQRLNGGGSILTPQEIRTCIMVMHSRERQRMISDGANRPDFTSLLSVSSEGEARQDHVDYYCRAIAHGFYEYERRYDIDEYVTKSIVDFISDDEFIFTSRLKRIDQTATLLYSIDKNILRRYEAEKFSRRAGRVAFETVFVGVLKNLDNILALPDPKTFVLDHVKEMWTGSHLDAFTSAGVRGTDRIRQTIPFGESWFAPDAD